MSDCLVTTCAPNSTRQQSGSLILVAFESIPGSCKLICRSPKLENAHAYSHRTPSSASGLQVAITTAVTKHSRGAVSTESDCTNASSAKLQSAQRVFSLSDLCFREPIGHDHCKWRLSSTNPVVCKCPCQSHSPEETYNWNRPILVC